MSTFTMTILIASLNFDWRDGLLSTQRTAYDIDAKNVLVILLVVMSGTPVIGTQVYESPVSSPQVDALPKPAMTEIEFLMVSSLQLGALKSLSVILGAESFIELLLVPQLVADPSKSPTKSVSASTRKDGDLQVCI